MTLKIRDDSPAPLEVWLEQDGLGKIHLKCTGGYYLFTLDPKDGTGYLVPNIPKELGFALDERGRLRLRS